ncbi:hypothetical protein N0Y54_42065 [Nostoc punctiforme UO1]|uniref:hypothetical protein n=1 Tax=Nostoc punctiforme TaxID=272131 RepID=UPI0030B1EBC7
MLTDYSFLTACVPLVRKEAASIDCSGIMDWQLRCRATAALPRLLSAIATRTATAGIVPRIAAVRCVQQAIALSGDNSPNFSA